MCFSYCVLHYYNASKVPQNTYSDISVDKFIQFLKSDPTYEYMGAGQLNDVEIDKRYLDNGEVIYLARISPEFMWLTILYMLDVNDGEIIGVVPVGLEGLDRHFKYDVIKISQGTFITAYCSSHMGNGGLCKEIVDDV